MEQASHNLLQYLLFHQSGSTAYTWVNAQQTNSIVVHSGHSGYENRYKTFVTEQLPLQSNLS